MPDSKKKNFDISIIPNEIIYTTISKSIDGYNSARIAVKKADKEHIFISYEWEGDYIPDFALNLMSFMKSNKVDASGIWPNKNDEYEEYAYKNSTRNIKI